MHTSSHLGYEWWATLMVKVKNDSLSLMYRVKTWSCLAASIFVEKVNSMETSQANRKNHCCWKIFSFVVLMTLKQCIVMTEATCQKTGWEKRTFVTVNIEVTLSSSHTWGAVSRNSKEGCREAWMGHVLAAFICHLNCVVFSLSL